jgi:hypothetical protein
MAPPGFFVPGIRDDVQPLYRSALDSALLHDRNVLADGWEPRAQALTIGA